MPSPLGDTRVGWISAAKSESVASFRLRSRMPAEVLRAAGVDAKVVDLASASDRDAIVFQKVYDQPHLDAAQRLRDQGKAVIFDLCDNHFYNPSGRRSIADRSALLKRMLEIAHVVTVSTAYLGATLERSSIVVPDCLEKVPVGAQPLRAARSKLRRAHSLRLVWSGNAGDAEAGWGVVALGQLRSPLSELQRQWDVHLTVITNDVGLASSQLSGFDCPTSLVPWRRQLEWLHYCWADVCVLPIIPNEFSYAKTANRVATALGRQMPVVASRHPAYEEFDGAVLFENWAENISHYRTVPAIVDEHVRRGNAIAQSVFGAQSVRDAWSRAIHEALAAI